MVLNASKAKRKTNQSPRKPSGPWAVVRFAVVFLTVYAILNGIYYGTPFKRLYTDLLLVSAGKLCAVTAAEPMKVFFYIPDDDRTSYDTVLGMVVDQRQVEARNHAIATDFDESAGVRAHSFPIPVQPLAFLPLSLVLSLLAALPVPWRRKLKTAPAVLFGGYLYVLVKWLVYIHLSAARELELPLVYGGWDATGVFTAANRILNTHFGFTFTLCLLLSVLIPLRPRDWENLRRHLAVTKV